MSSLPTFWMDRIRAANPVLAAVARGIAVQAALDEAYDVDAAVTAKLAAWHESPDGQTGRALRFAVLFYQENIAAKAG